MGCEYIKVLDEIGVDSIVVGNSERGCEVFAQNTGHEAFSGGIRKVLDSLEELPQYAIVATPINTLADATIALLQNGVTNILVEKPAGICKEEIVSIEELAKRNNANIYVAYNRRFYASTKKALEIIREDGGISSINFEFTEWADTIEKISNPMEEKENWLLANSSHVIDLAFLLAGMPKEITSYVNGELSWHHNGAVYAGAGITTKGALFSYNANWKAPGRWSIEALTSKHRLILCPMETLQIQNLNSISKEYLSLDDSMDKAFKPGLYEQVKTFLFNQKDDRLLRIEEHCQQLDFFEQIAGLSGKSSM
jgi:predicted dehydrogenase